MNSLGDNGADKVEGGFGNIPASFQSQFETFFASYANMCEVTSPTFRDVLFWASTHSEAADDRLRECQDAKDADYKRFQ